MAVCLCIYTCLLEINHFAAMFICLKRPCEADLNEEEVRLSWAKGKETKSHLQDKPTMVKQKSFIDIDLNSYECIDNLFSKQVDMPCCNLNSGFYSTFLVLGM